jgi:NAD(P)-dependent dehydrogenase (short-subunit alcohol dehydrogenase family)
MGLMDPGDRSALDTSLQTWRRVHDANLTSIFLSCKHGIRYLRSTEPAGGSVINATSFERSPGALDKRLVHWPMGRFGTLEEAAATIAFLASDDSGFITAAALPLDGGITEAFTVPD